MLPNFNNNGPCYELFSSATDIIKYWKQKGKIIKEFESHTKSYIYSLQFGGVSMLSIPINEKHSLQINNSCLLFQFIIFNNKSFSIEIGIKDKNDSKRRFNFTTSLKEIELKPLYIKIPLIEYPLNIWTNLLIDLEDLTQKYFKTQTFKVIDYIHLSGCLKIRKIFSLKTKDEPILKTVDMGKSIPIANLLLTESGNIIKKDIKIIGINNIYINNININSSNIQHSSNSPSKYNKKGNNSPISNNINKFSATSEMNLNRHKNYYRKKDENNKSNNDLSEGLNITPISNVNTKMENLSKITKDNVINAKKFVKGLPNVSNVKNDIKYAVIKNMKNNNYNLEENDSYNNSNKLLNNNVKEKGKSLGKYVYKHQKNKKRNKSNNPYLHNQLNKKIYENNDNNLGNNDLIITNNKNNNKEEINLNINSLKKSDKNNANMYTNKDKKINKNNRTPIKTREKENKEIQSNNHANINTYYNKKEQEVSLKEYHDSINNKNQKNENELKNSLNDNKYKFNNISLPNTIKENKNKYKQNENKQNKYSNYDNMLLDSGFDIKNIPVYDNIEEIAEWPVDLNPNANNGVIEYNEKMGDKLIQLDPGNKKNNKEINNNDMGIGDDFLEISSLLNKKETLRPYTPPIEELVQVNPNKMKGDSNMKCSMNKNNNLINTNKILKNYENLIYNPDKGLFYDPKTNIYYDIK